VKKYKRVFTFRVTDELERLSYKFKINITEVCRAAIEKEIQSRADKKNTGAKKV